MSENIFNLETSEKPKPKFTIKEIPKETQKESPAAKPEPKVETKVEPKKEVKSEEPKKDIVTLQQDLYIRQYPGFWEHVLTYKQVTKQDKQNIVKGQVYAILKQGTQVEIRRRINVIGGEVWGEISSGYIILSSKDGVYAK
jgi:hypothetical protein